MSYISYKWVLAEPSLQHYTILIEQTDQNITGLNISLGNLPSYCNK